MAPHSSTLAWKIPRMEEHGVAKSQTRLSDFPFTFHFHALEKEMATHSSVNLSNEYSGLISFGIDWFDLLAVQGTLKSLLNSSKASVLWHSVFFTVQLSHQYMTIGKTIALTIWTFVGKVMSLFCNMLYRFIIASLPRSKRLLILWLQSLSVVILEPPKIKSDTVSTVSPSISHEVMGPDAMIFECWVLSQLFKMQKEYTLFPTLSASLPISWVNY